MKELGIPLTRSEMRKIMGGFPPACFECTSDGNPTLATFYCSSTPDCASQTWSVCQGQTNCECHAG
jgi:hypothetical protein